MSNLNEKIAVIIQEGGVIVRAADARELATVSDDGEITYKNAAYAKGRYKEAIETAAKEYQVSGVAEPAKEDVPLVPVKKAAKKRTKENPPPRDLKHGYFSYEWLNYDADFTGDKEFAVKYTHCAESMLDWIMMRPELFKDIELLEERLGNLIK